MRWQYSHGFIELSNKIIVNPRMHSSRMRTARLLTVSRHALFGGGVPAQGGCTWPGVYLPRGVPAQGGVPAWGYLPRGVYLPGGVPAWGVYLPGGWGCTCPGECTCLGGTCPVNRMTDRCKKYYLAQNFVCGR